MIDAPHVRCHREQLVRESINVFIVFTPLHVLIADAIIRSENLRNVHVLAFTDGSTKTRRCCDRYLSRSISIAHVPLRRDLRVVFTFKLIAAFIVMLGPGRVVVHTGSLKSLYTRIFLGMLKRDFDLNTFDDGYGSLVQNGYFAWPDARLKRWAIALFGKQLDYHKLVSSIVKHFTIYDYENVYSRHCREVVKIEIQPRIGETPSEIAMPRGLEPLRVLLTQPISEHLGISVDDEVAAYNVAIARFQIRYRLPHPAERIGKERMLRATTIRSDLIAEELAYLLSSDGPIEFYAFGSTVLLNVTSIKNVTGYWLMHSVMNKDAPVYGAGPRLHVISLA